MAQGETEAAAAASDVLQVQHQIRANASELQDYFSDLYKWEKNIGKEEAARQQAAIKTPSSRNNCASPPPRARNATTVVNSNAPSAKADAAPSREASTEKPPDAHTYDKGYKKWEKFDVDAALRDADDDTDTTPAAEPTTGRKTTAVPAKRAVVTKSKSSVSISSKSREEIEREDGNEHYKRGDYVAAIKSYTRALGFDSRNVIVLSNRAMAYIKNREYGKAEDDCTLALKIDDKHIKSYSRRGTARNSLGKHRLALLDFERALELDPKSKQIAAQVASTREVMRTAIKRVPKRTAFSIKFVGETPKPKHPVPPVVEDKENAPRSANRKVGVIEEDPCGPAERISILLTTPAEKRSAAPPAPLVVSSGGNGGSPLPKLPKKAAATSYEFLRVWKTFAPKGDASRARKLLELRGSYLRQLAPASLPTVFKNSIESDLLCEMFATIRQVFEVTGEDKSFVVELVRFLPRVPRFSMMVMFLSDNEKPDICWVVEELITSEPEGSEIATQLQALKPQYGLQ